MDGKEMKYECVFKLPSDITDFCPIRTQWKTTPETMVEYCKICPYLEKYKVLINYYSGALEKDYTSDYTDRIKAELLKL